MSLIFVFFAIVIAIIDVFKVVFEVVIFLDFDLDINVNAVPILS